MPCQLLASIPEQSVRTGGLKGHGGCKAALLLMLALSSSPDGQGF